MSQTPNQIQDSDNQKKELIQMESSDEQNRLHLEKLIAEKELKLDKRKSKKRNNLISAIKDLLYAFLLFLR